MSDSRFTREEAVLEVARTYVIMARSGRLAEFDPSDELRAAGYALEGTNNERRSRSSEKEALMAAVKRYVATVDPSRVQDWLAEKGYMLAEYSANTKE